MVCMKISFQRNKMKDLSFFINYESKYRKTSEPDWLYVEGNGFSPTEEPLGFLRRGRFSQLSELAIQYHKRNGILSEVEWLILLCFMNDLSPYFRDDCYEGDVPDFVKEMQNVLDSVISKAPLFSGNTLYRFLTLEDKKEFAIGDVFVPLHSLTTTTDNWQQETDTYIVTPLPVSSTRAHSLYEIHNQKKEQQVNFERGTKFRVNEILTSNNYKKIYLSETH